MKEFGFLRIFWRPKSLAMGRCDSKWICNKKLNGQWNAALASIWKLIRVEGDTYNYKKVNEIKNKIGDKSWGMGNKWTRMLGLPITQLYLYLLVICLRKGLLSKDERMQNRTSYVNRWMSQRAMSCNVSLQLLNKK